jgi:hypothetical protein
VGVHCSGSCTTPAMTMATTLRTAPAGSGGPQRPVAGPDVLDVGNVPASPPGSSKLPATCPVSTSTPGCGRLAAFWNVGQPAPDVADAFAAVYRRVMPDLPFNAWARPSLDVYSVIFAKAANGIRQVGGFGDPEQWRFEWEWSYAREDWLDQLPTHGGHTQLPRAQLEELLTGVGTAIDAVGGSFTMGYTAVVVTAARTHSPT